MLPHLDLELDSLRSRGLYRGLRLVEGAQGPRVRINGKERLLFCSNNYLGLANHPALKDAADAALRSYGLSAAASRLISGTMEPHRTLELRMARFLGTESALCFPTGYMANLGAVTALVGEEDAIFSDRLNHRSIIDACRLSRAKTFVYRHRDVDHLESLLGSGWEYRRRLIVSDGLFSMDGDLAPLPGLVDAANLHNAILMVDDAHGTGVLGATGRGIHEHFGIAQGVDVLTTSGSKALGAYGGFVAGNAKLIELLVNRAAAFIYTSALPPDACAAATAALGLIESRPKLREDLWRNIRTVKDALGNLGFHLQDSQSQIVPVLIGDAARTMAISDRLFEKGIYLSGIRPPTVPEGESRLRLTLMADHSEDDINRLIQAMAEVRAAFF
ncbi:MAG: 8-amino-7-oxononanoate synthase [Gemmatimonadota bacterium]|nr:8-amino-7-oxononanoate synthase [Gemmatimonadota bacterium]